VVMRAVASMLLHWEGDGDHVVAMHMLTVLVCVDRSL
jgi:hypothetical protein